MLPGIAEQQLRDRLARSGTVLHVEVHAFPAIELLWHQADRVVIRMGQYRSSSPNLGSTLGQTADVGKLDVVSGGGQGRPADSARRHAAQAGQ